MNTNRPPIASASTLTAADRLDGRALDRLRPLSPGFSGLASNRRDAASIADRIRDSIRQTMLDGVQHRTVEREG